jgi:hypothetical protein
MKSKLTLIPLVLALALLSGCTRTYVLSLTNGTRLVSAGKPKLKNGQYIYKDVKGEEFSVSELRVREIAPASMAQESFSTGESNRFLK